MHPPHYKPGTVLCSLEVKDKGISIKPEEADSIKHLQHPCGT